MSGGASEEIISNMMSNSKKKRREIIVRSHKRKDKKKNHITAEPIIEGLDNELPPVNVRQNAFATFAAFAGAKAASLLTDSPDEGTAGPIFMSMLPARAGDHNIGDMCRIPTLLNVASCTGTSYNNTLNMDPCQLIKDGISACPTYMGYFSTMFRMWRGSIKVMYRFYTSPEVMARFQLSLDKAGSDGGSIDQTINEIITVKGDTVYTVTVPFVHPSDWVKCTSWLNQLEAY
jgi:hypothetical protein